MILRDFHLVATSVALLGGGGHASDVLSVLEALPSSEGLESIYVADDHWERRDRFDGRNVILVDSICDAATLAPYIVAVGYPSAKKAVHQVALDAGGTPSRPVVHPKAIITTNVSLDNGVVILGNTWISALAQIGEHVYISCGTTVGHDTIVGAFSSLMPGSRISGDAMLGEGVMVGSNAVVLPGVRVGDWAQIGAGAVVTRDVASGQTVVGAPAHPKR